MKRERRYLPAQELRVQNDSGEKTISGYAVVYNSLSEDMGFREMVAPGCFTEFLKNNPDVRCLFNHDENRILGRTSAGTLTLSDDAHGLAFRCVLPNNTVGNDLAVTMERGDVSNCSFGFTCEDADWNEQDGYLLRTIKKAQIFDVSPVVFPAYQATSVGLRSLFPDGEVEIPGEFRSKTAEEQASEAQTEDDDSSECDNLLASIIERRLKH